MDYYLNQNKYLPVRASNEMCLILPVLGMAIITVYSTTLSKLNKDVWDVSRPFATTDPMLHLRQPTNQPKVDRDKMGPPLNVNSR